MANFKCECGKQYFINSYSYNGKDYRDSKTKKLLLCECGKELEYVEKSFEGGVPYFGKIASMTPNQRSEVLKKRSQEHFSREGKEQKHEMLKRSGMDSGY